MAELAAAVRVLGGPVDVADELVGRAARAAASDVHLLPQPDGLLVRMRIDGVLHDVDRIDNAQAGAIVSRFKVLGHLDVADHEKAQDGRFSAENLDIRVSILPTVLGEGIVLRLLRREAIAPSLTNLGLVNEMQMDLELVLSRTSGLFLVVGPTGAGKSTTLYAALADVNSPQVNVVTIEDPVEYRVPRSYQIQVNEKRGLNFHTALRSILRSDPDIIMVGEIRDEPTAELVVEASLSGHLVLSTLHSEDAPRALTRMAGLGIAPRVLGTSLTAILAQRLARRLCPACREPYEPPVSELEQLSYAGPPLTAPFFRPRGCHHCTAGYAGRIGIFQLMPISELVTEALSDGGNHDAVSGAATAEGMRTLWDDGLQKVVAGLTSVQELRRVMM